MNNSTETSASETMLSPEVAASLPKVHLRPGDVQFVESVARIYQNERWPHDELLDVMHDVMRMIYKIAKQYTDPTCAELCQDELESAGRQKFIARLQWGILAKPNKYGKFMTRGDLFSHLRACLGNHLKSYVYKCRYTVKRTGRKVPPKGSNIEYDRSFKPEVSLSDPDVSATVERAASSHDDATLRRFTEDMVNILTPLEFLVYQQHVEPNTRALAYATLDAWRGNKDCTHVVIRDEHKADGLGLDVELFQEVTDQLKPKVTHYMSDKSVQLESGYHLAVGNLEKIFNLQIPRTLEPMVLRRLLTIAARANFDLVTPEVADMLTSVGARVPQKAGNTDNLTCYGVLYQKNHKVCSACQLRDACSVETANYGLSDIVLSPKLLSAKALVRTPAITSEVPPATVNPAKVQVQAPPTPAKPVAATVTVADETAPLDAREDELKSYMYQHFKPAMFKGELYFRHKEHRPNEKVRQIFWLGRRDGKLTVRFCKPSVKLTASLEKSGASYYPPANLSMRAVLELVNQHASETV